ncbi:FMRFamide receptor-like [Patella vulgata]|uniref:FMRFamide receptor-like n=1 Tax=Patella vulgata TaxID=6465 RepID=UPI00217F7086|nr:FMRFamide receptor-like [Patella vulgata]
MIPIICIIGIVGNTLAAGAFLSASLRTTSCCLYLAVKCLSDIGFLSSLFIVWLYRVHVPIFNTNGLCQLYVFLSYICAFLSVWLVVIITFENFIRISQPQWVGIICTPRTAKIVIVVCVTMSLIFYNYPLWTAGIVNVDGSALCSTREQFQNVVMVLTYVDTFLTLIIPFVIMLILVPLITIAALQAYERKKRLFRNARRESKGSSPETQVTKLLFAVSVVFLALHTPGHAIRVKLMIVKFLQHVSPSYLDVTLQRLFEIFYYMDFCLSLAVYLIFGANFRKVFAALYFKKCQRQNELRRIQANVNNTVSKHLLKENGQSGVVV